MTYTVHSIDVNDLQGLEDYLNTLSNVDFVFQAGAVIVVISH